MCFSAKYIPGFSFELAFKPTSSPAAAIWPLLRAAMRSSSTTNPPREVFTTIAPRGNRPMVVEFKK